MMFFNEKNELVTDIDFDVIICSINEEIFLPEANQEPTSGHYYKVDGGLYGVTDGVFDCDNNIISLVDVKFNNHNGETLFAC
ncbi:MAG: hypothetical protein MJ233_05245 [Mycoplasmoidaceae bacterium]|nr:hypothetical protein [Mycoplasmoidaceae bacterium]